MSTTRTDEEFAAALDRFLAAAKQKVDARFVGFPNQGGRLDTENGPKYVRVVIFTGMGDPSKWSSKSVFCFVDRETGRVWKAAGYKGPERKNPRSCIYDADHGASGITGYGTVYLR